MTQLRRNPDGGIVVFGVEIRAANEAEAAVLYEQLRVLFASAEEWRIYAERLAEWTERRPRPPRPSIWGP
jgi:hypothetical protein